MEPIRGSFDIDMTQMSYFLEERKRILLQNVTRASTSLASSSAITNLLQFELAVRLYLDNCPIDLTPKRTVIGNIFRELLDRKSKNGGDNMTKWLLYQQLKQHELPFDAEDEAVTSVLSTLTCDTRQDNTLIKQLITEKRYFSDEMIGCLKELVLQNPILAEIVVHQMNEILRVSTPKLGDSFRFLNYNFVITDSLIYSIHKKPVDLNLIIMLFHILHEDEVNDEKLQASLQHFANSDNMASIFSSAELFKDFILSLVGRESSQLANILLDLRWTNLKKEGTQFLIKTDENSGESFFDNLNCFILGLKDKRHFVEYFLNSTIDSEVVESIRNQNPNNVSFWLTKRIEKLPNMFRLFFLLMKMQSDDDRMWEDYAKILNLTTFSPSNRLLLSRDEFSSDLLARLMWSFRFTYWITDLSSNIDRDQESKATVFKYILTSLFSEKPVLQVLADDTILTDVIDYQNFSKFDAFHDEMMVYLNSPEYSYLESYSWLGFLCVRFTFYWLTEMNETFFASQSQTVKSSESEEDDFDDDEDLQEASLDLEFSSRIRRFLRSINCLFYRTEILENMFACLLLTSNSLEDSVQKSESKFFLVKNEVIPKFLTFLKEMTFETQSAFRASMNVMQHDSSNLPVEPIPLSSIRTINEVKIRLDRLSKSIHEGQWRYSVVQTSFDCDHMSITSCLPSGSYMEAMLSSPQKLLRHSLANGYVDQAKQVFKLFEQDLRGTEEVRQLRINSFIQDLTDKIRVITSSGKKYPQPHPHSSYRGESMIKGVKTSQVHSLFADFLRDISPHTIEENEAALLLIDYSLTRCPNLEVSQIAMEQGIAAIKGKSDSIDKLKEFLTKIKEIVVVTKSSIGEGKEITLPHLIAFNTGINLFSNPNSLIEESVKRKKLTECIEDIRHLLKMSLGNEDDSVDVDSGKGDEVLLRSGLAPESNHLLVLFQKLLRLCPPGKNNYLKGLFFHVKKVSKVLNECRARSRKLSASSISRQNSLSFPTTSYFSVLYQSPSAILCQMVLKENIPPNLVDDLSQEMKVDLMSTLCSILCPPLKVCLQSSQDSNDFNLIASCYPSLSELVESFLTGSMKRMREEPTDPDQSYLIENHFKSDDIDYYDEDNRNIISKPNLVLYFHKKSPLLVEVLRLLKLIDESRIKDLFERDIKIGPDSVLVRYIEKVKSLFSNGSTNETSILTLAMLPYIPLSSSVVMRSLEQYAVSKDLISIHSILSFYNQSINGSEFNNSLDSLNTAVLSKLALQKEDVSYILQIQNPRSKVDLILEAVNASSNESSIFSNSATAIQAIQAVKGSLDQGDWPSDLISSLKSQLDKKVKEITVFSKIAELSGLKTWSDPLILENLTDADILTILKTKKQYTLAIDWNSLHEDSPTITRDPQTEELRYELLIISYAEKENVKEIEKLLSTIVFAFSGLVLKILPQIENWKMRKELINLAVQYEEDVRQKIVYSNYLLGIQLIQLLPLPVRSYYAPLMSKPNLVIEQMLMNTEYAALEEALKTRQLINCDDLIELYAKKAVDIKLTSDNDSFTGSDYTCISSSFLPDSEPGRAFVMPTMIPTREQWIPDRKVQHCMVCKIEKFSVLFNRKHHCRRCGRVVCHSCSDRCIIISEVSEQIPVRVCINCYSHLKPSDESDVLPPGRKESFSSLSSSISVYQWVLSLNDEQNKMRQLFYYEAAPSSSLCLSILKLHTNISSCIGMILDQMVKGLFEVLTSSQVDYGLLINIVKSLLVSVKVIIETHLHGSIEMRSRLEYVNLMSSRIDIVNMLVQQNCIQKDLINFIILNESQSNSQSLVRLMERLLEVERFELALNIAKKYGLDVKSIWKTWAIICLRSGKFQEARIRFKHVMQDGPIVGSTSAANAKVLQTIFDCFEDSRTGLKQQTRMSTKERVDLLKKGKVSSIIAKDLTTRSATFNECSIPQHLIDEGLYYLKTYGSKEDFVKFYTRFGMWKNALEVFLTESNSSSLLNSFVQDLLLLSMKRSVFSKLLLLLKANDPTLVKSHKYLLAACKYFSRIGYYNTLHSLQLFMGDYIRAAITQVTFFFLEKPYDSYAVLKTRLNHLAIARGHLTTYLDSYMSTAKNNPWILSQSITQVKRNIKTIDIQTSITKFFADKGLDGFLPIHFDSVNSEFIESPTASALSTSGLFTRSMSLESSISLSASPSSTSQFEGPRESFPLTLFDESKARKIQFAALVAAEYGSKVSEGMTVAHQIVTEYRLDEGLVYRLTGRIILTSKKALIIDRLNQLVNYLKSIEESNTLCDVVVGACIRACSYPDLIEPMIKLLTSDINKIDAYILCGKLRQAYLLAIRLERETDVRRILAVAERCGPETVKGWCTQWLEKNSTASRKTSLVDPTRHYKESQDS